MFKSKSSVVLFTIFLFIVGSNAFKVQPRIFQGVPSERGQWPFYVFLEAPNGDKTKSCGGSLISDQWVLTAAHCLENNSQIAVHLGVHETRDALELGREVWLVDSENFHLHQDYSPKHILHDIGLIKLPMPIEFTRSIKKIKLSKPIPSVEFIETIAIGNGFQNLTGAQAEVSKFVEHVPLTIIRMSLCKDIFPSLKSSEGNKIFCAAGSVEQSVCQGDSGGPLIRKSDKTLLGIASFVHELGCQAGFPQAFTNVAEYIPWISEVTGISFHRGWFGF